MPSPIAHLTAAYVAQRIGLARAPAPEAEAPQFAKQLLVTAAAFSMLPDVDAVAGVLAGDFGGYHNEGTHSLLVGAGVSLAFAGLMAWRRRSFLFWFLVAAGCYGAHVLMDASTPGRGVLAAWPLSDRRFDFPLTIFYGLHWSDGLISVRHVWTVLSELLFVGVVGVLLAVVGGRTKGGS